MNGISLAFISFFFLHQNTDTRCKDLRPLFEKYEITVKNQGARGTCSIFTIVGLIEFERANVLGDPTPLSVEYLNWAANKTEGRDADGSFFHYAIDGMLKYGICADDYMPYATRFSEKAEPSEVARKDAGSRKTGQTIWIKTWDPKNGITAGQLQKIKKELDGNHPVAIGFRWLKGEVENKYLEGGELAMVTEEQVFDGHSVLIVGYHNDEKTPGGGYLIFKNSYGESFGDNGYGRIPYAYALLYANDAMALHLN
ncbi:MAG: C1 family peptidase [Bacteroidales bacterium]|jgi:hypothetical protein|nr:C1 family peptidase [Bacteroidales bacterium]